MRRSRAALSAVAVTAVASIVLAGCSQQSNQNSGQTAAAATGFPETADAPDVPGKPGGVFRLGIVEPTAIDPYNAQETEGILVNKQLFTGLVDVEPDGTVIPGVADTWTPNADCTQWTFALKPGTTFSNGEVVDSAAFKRGWERTAAKASASDIAYHLDEVQGYAQLQDGSATTLSGVDAADPNVLKVALAKPDCEFELRGAHPALSPVPTVAGPASNTTYNDLPIGNGPFKMDGPWQHDKGVRLVRNDSYGAGPKANLDAVEITIVPADQGVQAEYNGFRNGQFDWARMPTPVLAQARTQYEPQGEWLNKKTAGSDYLLPMVTQKPLDTPTARKAISEAIDRNAIAQGVFQNSKVPATSLVPASFKDAYQDGVCTACKYDVEDAKRLAQESGLVPGTEVNFQFNTGGGHEEWTAAVKQQLETNLGLKVTYGGVPFRDLLDNEQAPGATGIYRAGWLSDYPTPGNFLGPLLATSSIGAATPKDVAQGDNRGRYSNPQFDSLLAQASSTQDEAKRNDLYKQAEKIAIGDDLALIPLFARQTSRLVNTQKFANLRMDYYENPTLATVTLK
jgi:oligopeptide transport system substrate-binding protein